MEATHRELTSTQQRKEISLQNAGQEIDRLKTDISSKRQVLQQLSSARNDLVDAEREYEEYKRNIEQNRATWQSNLLQVNRRSKVLNITYMMNVY